MKRVPAIDNVDGQHPHPWLDALSADPEREFARLIRGGARISPYDRADPPDVAAMVFAGLDSKHPAWRAVDLGAIAYLDMLRREPFAERSSRGLHVHISEGLDVLRIVGRLRTLGMATNLRRRYPQWFSWVDALELAPSLDLRAEYWRTLAQTQELFADSSILDPFSLEPLWLRICSEADVTYPHYYLNIGLLGLRRLPMRNSAPSELPVIRGLVRWAGNRPHADKDFISEWESISSLYPRSPHHWASLMETVLEDTSITDILSQGLRSYLDKLLGHGSNPRDSSQRYRFKSRRRIEPPSADVVSDIALRARTDKFERIYGEILLLIQNETNYARATGDSSYFVVTAGNIGHQLLKGKDASSSRALLASQLALQALAWNSRNSYAWALWRDALVSHGEMQAAEIIGWESIRRLPEFPHLRTQLAHLFVSTDREDIAVALLEDAIRIFPDNPFSYSQLGEILISQGNVPAAELIFKSAFERGANGAATYAGLARIFSATDRGGEAVDILNSGLEIYTQGRESDVLRKLLRFLKKGRLRLLSARSRRDASAPTAGQIWPDGSNHESSSSTIESITSFSVTRKADFFLKKMPTFEKLAWQYVYSTLQLDQNFSYAQFVRARNDASFEIKREVLPSIYPLALEQARRIRTKHEFRNVMDMFPNLGGVTAVTATLKGDLEFVPWAFSWTQDSPYLLTDLTRPLRTLLHEIGADVSETRFASAMSIHGPRIESTIDDMLAASFVSDLVA